MRKLSLLVALALLITIGGVYATWDYANADSQANHQHMSINLATATTTAAEGTILNVLNSMNIMIDDSNDDYKADLTISGIMGYVFVPSPGASQDVKDNGIQMQWKLEQTDPAIQFKGVNIFTIKQASATALDEVEITASNAKDLCSGVDLTQYIGYWYVEVDADDILGALEISLQLPTHDDYDDFSQELAATAGKLGVTISEDK